MKIIGIIVEYNPLQNGHAYQIEVAKQQFNADYVVLVMTGNFNERGLPAIIPKENRARMGINAGADLVIELPTCYSLSDLPRMALGAIEIFDKIGVVDNLLFGSELGELYEIEDMSEIMTSDRYLLLYDEFFKTTAITSKAREKAFIALGFEKYARCINNPNNLLGVTFLQTLKTINSKIKPITHKRIGQSYLDDSVELKTDKKIFSSATAVRRMIKESYLHNGTISEKLKCCVPSYVYDDLVLSFNMHFPVFSDDFNNLILCAIKNSTIQKISDIDGIDDLLANELFHSANEALDFDIFDSQIRQRFPHINIDRRYYRILTNQTAEDIHEYEKNGSVFFASILAAGKRAGPLLDRMKDESKIDFFYEDNMTVSICNLGMKQLENNRSADCIYNTVLYEKFGRK